MASGGAEDEAIAAAVELLAGVTHAAACEGLALARAAALPLPELHGYLAAASAQSAALTAVIAGDHAARQCFSEADERARARGLDLPLLRGLAELQRERDGC